MGTGWGGGGRGDEGGGGWPEARTEKGAAYIVGSARCLTRSREFSAEMLTVNVSVQIECIRMGVRILKGRRYHTSTSTDRLSIVVVTSFFSIVDMQLHSHDSFFLRTRPVCLDGMFLASGPMRGQACFAGDHCWIRS